MPEGKQQTNVPLSVTLEQLPLKIVKALITINPMENQPS